jgi:hypothetical protein
VPLQGVVHKERCLQKLPAQASSLEAHVCALYQPNTQDGAANPQLRPGPSPGCPPDPTPGLMPVPQAGSFLAARSARSHSHASNRDSAALWDGDVLERALDTLHESKELFAGRFEMHSPTKRRRSTHGVVQFARGHFDGVEYAIKCALSPTTLISAAPLRSLCIPPAMLHPSGHAFSAALTGMVSMVPMALMVPCPWSCNND